MIATLVGAACPLIYLIAVVGLLALVRRNRRRPCCQFAQSSAGTVHGHDCTRKDQTT